MPPSVEGSPTVGLLVRGRISVCRRGFPRARREGGGVIGRLEKTVLDCPDPRLLARFYAQVLGMQVVEEDDDWVVIGRATGWRELAFQRATAWTPPTWPEGPVPQQAHLDVRVTDVEDAERAVLGLGASAVGG